MSFSYYWNSLETKNNPAFFYSCETYYSLWAYSLFLTNLGKQLRQFSDSIRSSAEIGEHERTKLIKTIIDDSGIESILVAQR